MEFSSKIGLYDAFIVRFDRSETERANPKAAIEFRRSAKKPATKAGFQ
jgi:hypothetical protein